MLSIRVWASELQEFRHRGGHELEIAAAGGVGFCKLALVVGVVHVGLGIALAQVIATPP